MYVRDSARGVDTCSFLTHTWVGLGCMFHYYIITLSGTLTVVASQEGLLS